MAPGSRGYTSTPQADPLELRASPRVGMDVSARIYSSEFSGPLAARTRDLSVSGACLATASPFAVKSVDRLDLMLPTGTVTVRAEGRWQRDETAQEIVLTGVAFPDLEPEAFDALWRMVLDAGSQLARLFYERSDIHTLGLEEAMGLAQVSRYRDVPAGRYVYRQDTREAGEDSIYLLMSGSVVLQLRVRNAIETDMVRLAAGDLFGGLPLLADVPHAESAVAESDVRLLEIDRAAYQYIRSAKPWLGYRLGSALLRACALRLRQTLVEVSERL